MSSVPRQAMDAREQPVLGISGAERRRSSREAFMAKAWVSAQPGTRGASKQVVVNDLSLHGVGFNSDDKYDAGSVHWIVLGAGGLRASSRMRIISCRQCDNGTYDSGAEFF